MADVFLSDAWFEQAAKRDAAAPYRDKPVLNLVVTGGPQGEKRVRMEGNRIEREHANEADATITLPFRLAYAVFVGGDFRAPMQAYTEGRIQVEGDLGALASIGRASGDELRELRDKLLHLTLPPANGHELTGDAASRARVLAEIDRLDLRENVRELDVNGLTIVPPEKTGMDPAFIDRVRARVFELMEEQTGVEPDVETGETHRNVFYPSLYYYLFEDRIFEELLMNEYQLAIASYMCGEDCVLSSCTAFIKGPADPPSTGSVLQLGLHADNRGSRIPEPYPPPQQNLRVNCTWLLTDYTAEDGATAYVPGSHLLCRCPIGLEGEDRIVPIEAPRGSLVAWGGNTWHGSLPRSKPGLRAGLAWGFSRPFVTFQCPFQLDVTEEMLARNPQRFAVLMGQTLATGWRREGPERLMARRAEAAARRASQQPRP